MKARCLLGVTLLLTPPGAAPRAAPPWAAGDALAPEATAHSFLFSRPTLGLIEAARIGKPAAAATTERAARPRPVTPAGIVHLAAIVYRAPDDWRIWLNGRSFTPAARPVALEILEVTATAVVLAWPTGAGAPRTRVELRANQSYLVASGRIVEGNPGPPRSTPP